MYIDNKPVPGQEQGERGALTFARHEVKYRVPEIVYPLLLEKMKGMFRPDLYPHSLVMSLYYDTDSHDLISRSLMKPAYKEKLRLRSYGIPKPDSTVYPELKKKYDGVVYKRRAAMSCREAELFLNKGILTGESGQIVREIEYFRDFYHPHPEIVIVYERDSYVGIHDPDLRVTFDYAIRFRQDHLKLTYGDGGEMLDMGGDVLMEVKAKEAIPFEFARMLSRFRLYPNTFSKYGTIYRNIHAGGEPVSQDRRRRETYKNEENGNLCLPV